MNNYEYTLKKFDIDSEAKSPVSLQYKRDELAKLFKELNFKSGAEIGVARGKFSAMVCEMNPNLKLYSIDPWIVYDGYDEKHSKDENNFRYNYIRASRLLRSFKNCKIIKKLSMDAVKDFTPESLDFVYIDGNHAYKYVLEDITEWAKIVRKGGIISGHDYKAYPGTNINIEPGQAIDKYVKENNIKMLFTFVKENDGSWFFVNE